jgi:purine-binding chemotaxis protein CheW
LGAPCSLESRPILKEKMPSTIAALGDNSSTAKSNERAGKYLTFLIGKEEFGVGVMKVREIMRMQDITAVPGTPDYLKGVMNLRGKIIPVIDLRLKFGLPAIESTKRTCVIVVQVDGAAMPLLMGMVVDEVSEVLVLTPADIEDTPDFGSSVATAYILGMAKSKGKVKILLDINRVLSSQEIHRLEAVLQ